MNHLLARNISSSGKQSESDSTSAPSDGSSEKSKGIPYTDMGYEKLLAARNSFADDFIEGVHKESSKVYQTLLSSVQLCPLDSLFRDDLFNMICKNVRNRNKAMVVRDILPLVIPFAQTLATYGGTNLSHLVESVDDGWTSCRPMCGARTQPDYSLGLGSEAFTQNQLEKLKPFIGDGWDISTSLFKATPLMYFPFLSCEVNAVSRGLTVQTTRTYTV